MPRLARRRFPPVGVVAVGTGAAVALEFDPQKAQRAQKVPRLARRRFPPVGVVAVGAGLVALVRNNEAKKGRAAMVWPSFARLVGGWVQVCGGGSRR